MDTLTYMNMKTGYKLIKGFNAMSSETRTISKIKQDELSPYRREHINNDENIVYQTLNIKSRNEENPEEAL